MKKIICLVFALILAAPVFGCCSSDTYSFYVPDGAPLLTVTKLMSEKRLKIGGKRVKMELVTGASISNSVKGKQPDIAIAPINVCAQGEGTYVFAGTAVTGLSYIAARDYKGSGDGITLSNLIGADSDGKEDILYAFQKNGTPGITLRALLEEKNITYKELGSLSDYQAGVVNIMYLNSPADVRNAMCLGLEGGPKIKYGLMTEPVITAVLANSSYKVSRVFDIQKEWSKEFETESYPQAGVIVRKSIADSDPEFVSALYTALQNSVKWAKDYPALAGDKAKDEIGSNELPSAEIIKAFIEGTGKDIITFKKSADCKKEVNDYLKIVSGSNPALVGKTVKGDVPAESFYL